MAEPGDYSFPQARILLFARAPLVGKVKTRLIPALGEQGALAIHLQLLTRQIQVLQGNSLCPAQLWLDQPSGDPLVEKFNGDIYIQQGKDLGERMFNAAAKVLAGTSPVVIIGSDCPELDQDYLQQALQALDHPQNDIVLGPALDGGYVLIGMKKAEPHIFTGIDWGSEQVLQQTLSRLEEKELSCHLLSPLCDVDTEADLERLL